MKVIKDNRPEARFQFPMKLSCRSCHSELEASKSDLKYMNGDFRDDGYYYIECPLCKFKNGIKPPLAGPELVDAYYSK